MPHEFLANSSPPSQSRARARLGHERFNLDRKHPVSALVCFLGSACCTVAAGCHRHSNSEPVMSDLREALKTLRDANMSYSLVSDVKNARRLEQAMRDAEAALA